MFNYFTIKILFHFFSQIEVDSFIDKEELRKKIVLDSKKSIFFRLRKFISNSF